MLQVINVSNEGSTKPHDTLTMCYETSDLDQEQTTMCLVSVSVYNNASNTLIASSFCA